MLLSVTTELSVVKFWDNVAEYHEMLWVTKDYNAAAAAAVVVVDTDKRMNRHTYRRTRQIHRPTVITLCTAM